MGSVPTNQANHTNMPLKLKSMGLSVLLSEHYQEYAAVGKLQVPSDWLILPSHRCLRTVRITSIDKPLKLKHEKTPIKA